MKSQDGVSPARQCICKIGNPSIFFCRSVDLSFKVLCKHFLKAYNIGLCVNFYPDKNGLNGTLNPRKSVNIIGKDSESTHLLRTFRTPKTQRTATGLNFSQGFKLR